MTKEIRSFIQIVDRLADMNLCHRVHRKDLNCYSFDLGVADWWLAVYVRQDTITFKLFNDNLKSRELTWTGLHIKNNTLVFEFKGLDILVDLK